MDIITVTKTYNSIEILFSNDAKLLQEKMEGGTPVVALLSNKDLYNKDLYNENLCEPNIAGDLSSFKYALMIEENGRLLSEDEILELADDNYCQILLARFYKRPLIISVNEEITIRELSLEDLDSLMEVFEQESMKVQGLPFIEKFYSSKEEALIYLKDYIDNVYAFYNYGIWGIYVNEGTALAGIAGFKNASCEDIAKNIKQFVIYENTGDTKAEIDLEISYALNEKYRGRGLAYKALGMCIDYAINFLDFNKIIANIDELNTSSIKLASKLINNYHK